MLKNLVINVVSSMFVAIVLILAAIGDLSFPDLFGLVLK